MSGPLQRQQKHCDIVDRKCIYGQGHKNMTCSVSVNLFIDTAVMGGMMRTAGEDLGTGCKEVRRIIKSKSTEVFVGVLESFRMCCHGLV